MRLAELVGATGRPGQDGVVDVYVGGTALVRGATSEALEVQGTTDLSTATSDPVHLVWSGGGYPAAVTSGKAAAHADTLNSIIPEYADKLDAFAASLAAAVNAEHASAYALDGSQPGDFFTGTTAKTLHVALTGPAQVAAGAHSGTLDGSVADRIGKIAGRTDGPDSVYRDVIVSLGVASQTAARRSEIQANVTAQVDAARESQAGVDMDEEMVNLITYQRAYEGASRVMNAVDSALDTLINRTGLVGR